MGRKIPAKKHRGVKDPLKQQALRLQSLQGKINAPPKDPDEQPVPKSLIRLFAFQDTEKERKPEKKRIKRNVSAKNTGHATGDNRNPVKHMRRTPGESARAFSLRINSAVRALQDPTHQDYPEDMDQEDVKGERIAIQRERRRAKHEKARRVASASAAGGSGGSGGALTAGGEPAASGRARRRLLRKMKVAEALERQRQRPETVYERVSFGDVAHAPPALAAPRAAAASRRAGQRELLLTGLLQGGGGAAAGGGARARARAEGAGERARLEAVAAYRALKATRIKKK